MFGIGPRACIGRKVAHTEAVLLLAYFLRDWVLDVGLAPGETRSEYEKKVMKVGTFAGTVLPIDKVSLKIRRRRVSSPEYINRQFNTGNLLCAMSKTMKEPSVREAELSSRLDPISPLVTFLGSGPWNIAETILSWNEQFFNSSDVSQPLMEMDPRWGEVIIIVRNTAPCMCFNFCPPAYEMRATGTNLLTFSINHDVLPAQHSSRYASRSYPFAWDSTFPQMTIG